MTDHESEKALRYISLLDTARSNENWAEVPELVRKVTKHAPHRTCLILAANTELKIVQYTSNASNVRLFAGGPQIPELAQLIPPLLSAIGAHSHPNSDVFQCQTCLASIHWLLSEPGLACSRLPKDIFSLYLKISELESVPLDYPIICMLKSIYMKASYQKMEGDIPGSLASINSVVPWMLEHEPRLLSQQQLLLWSERLLAQLALTASDGVDWGSLEMDKHVDAALQGFRYWAIFTARSNETAANEQGIVRPLKKAEIWKAYYLFLSRILRHGFNHHAARTKQVRLYQAAELRRIEALYEGELLRATHFPKAHESNRAIEEWVEQVIQNWKILCGRSWAEADLGEGGGNAVGRNVLDILYRAATKTFHSTLILRRLFQVHKFLAEFNLAYKALDTYLELVVRAKARAQNFRDNSIGIDDEASVLMTLSEAIEGLCAFGSKDEAEKAFNLTGRLEQWAKDYSSKQASVQLEESTHSKRGKGDMQITVVDHRTLEIAYRAIGIGKAFWAMWTPMSEQRFTYQSEALASFMQATLVLSHLPLSLETAYAQALLFAETRDLESAIDCARRALSTSTAGETEYDYGQQHKVIRLWHLLALLLSARQEFGTAHQMCGAAFDQFVDTNGQFGDRTASAKGGADDDGDKLSLYGGMTDSVDSMSGREREDIIQIRMTELALVELAEGPEEAVNGSHNLLGLFSRLFGHLVVGRDERATSKEDVPPKSSAGTTKSLRGSIFGRKRHEPTIPTQTQDVNGVSLVPPTDIAHLSGQTTEAPQIQVTNEDLKMERWHSHSLRRLHSHKLQKREESKGSVIRRRSRSAAPGTTTNIVSDQRPSSFNSRNERLSRRSSTIGLASNAMADTNPNMQTTLSSAEEILTAKAPSLEKYDQDPKAKVTLRPIAHNIDLAKVPPPVGHDKQPPQQDIRLPIIQPSTMSTQPPPHFPRAAQQIHAHGILAKVWLFVAGLYRRASLFEDSLEAYEEASRNASQVEALVATRESSAAAFADAGWTGGRSSNGVWADVHAERGNLASAQGMPHEAAKHFEEALMYSLDHPMATLGLSNILLDIYEQKIPSEPPQPGLDVQVSEKWKQSHDTNGKVQDGLLVEDDLRKTPEYLNRLAARDRAYGLLSNLTKLGTSWDDSDSWYALARAHECSGQIEKAREVLWWCVELEDKRPVRHWRNIGTGSYVL